MFVPPGYHMGASISDTEQTEKEHGEQPFTYAPNMGLGYVMMNGCYGTNYTPSDPCYNAKFASPICLVRETNLSRPFLPSASCFQTVKTRRTRKERSRKSSFSYNSTKSSFFDNSD